MLPAPHRQEAALEAARRRFSGGVWWSQISWAAIRGRGGAGGAARDHADARCHGQAAPPRRRPRSLRPQPHREPQGPEHRGAVQGDRQHLARSVRRGHAGIRALQRRQADRHRALHHERHAHGAGAQRARAGQDHGDRAARPGDRRFRGGDRRGQGARSSAAGARGRRDGAGAGAEYRQEVDAARRRSRRPGRRYATCWWCAGTTRW